MGLTPLSLLALIKPFSFIERGGEAFRLNNYTGQVAKIQQKGVIWLPEMPYVEPPTPPLPPEPQAKTFRKKIPEPYNWSIHVRTKLITHKVFYTFSLSEWTYLDELLETLKGKTPEETAEILKREEPAALDELLETLKGKTPEETAAPKDEKAERKKTARKSMNFVNFMKGDNAIILHFKDKDGFVLHRLHVELAKTSRTVDDKDQNKVMGLTTQGSFEIQKDIAEKIESMSALWTLENPAPIKK